MQIAQQNLDLKDPAESAFTRFHKPLIRFLRLRGVSAPEAEDLTQAVFVRLFETYGRATQRFDPQLVFTIAGNMLKDRRRQLRRRGQQISLDDDGPGLQLASSQAQAATQEREVVAKDTLAAIVRALEDLDPVTAKMFLLARVEFMPAHEIAEIYGCTRRTVDRRVTQAIAHIVETVGPNQPWS